MWLIRGRKFNGNCTSFFARDNTTWALMWNRNENDRFFWLDNGGFAAFFENVMSMSRRLDQFRSGMIVGLCVSRHFSLN
jgi:hypothetical protein